MQTWTKILLILFVAPIAHANYFALDANCVAVYNLENGALGTDSQGNNDLTNSGVTNSSTCKQGGNSGDFEQGDPDYMYISDASLDTGFPMKSTDATKNISVCAWFKMESVGATVEEIASKYDPTNNKRSFGLYISTGGTINWAIGKASDSGSTANVATDATVLVTGRWYHVIATYQNSDKSYIIKVWDDTGQTFVVNASGNVGDYINVEDASFLIGGADQYASGYFDGLIDEVVVFNDILSAAEMLAVKNGTYGVSGDSGGEMDL